MIIDLHEKIDVSPEWFEEQVKRDSKEAWIGRLSELLAVYRVKDEDGAAEAAERMKAVVGDCKSLKTAME